MFKEEEYITRRFGKTNHFKVPEGYFDDLGSRIMANIHNDNANPPAVPSSGKEIPLHRPHFLIRYRRVIAGVAAGLCIAVFSLGSLLPTGHNGESQPAKQVQTAMPQKQQMQTATPQTHGDTGIDDFVEYSMLDNEDMYAYMTDAI